MQRMAGNLFLILLTFTAITTAAQAKPLRILSWNVFMLPKPLKFSLQVTRTHRIVEKLKALPHDVVVLQEAFDRHFRSHIKEDLKAQFPHMYYLGKENLVYPFMSSGVYVLSKLPFRTLDFVFFDWCGTADCYASKGAVGLEFELQDEKRLQLFATHLQSEERFSLSRFHQTNQIKGLMARYAGENVSQLLIGDLNIDAGTAEFEETLGRLGTQALPLEAGISHTFGDKNPCYKTSGSKYEWLDHVLVKDPEKRLAFSELRVLEMSFERNGETCPLSDHLPVEASVSFASPESPRPLL